jgi:WD40 repeat protein
MELGSHNDHTVRVWDVVGRISEAGEAFEGPSDAVASVTFSPNSTQLRSETFDGEIFLWDAVSGSEIVDSAERRWTKGLGLDMRDGWIIHQGYSIYVPPEYRSSNDQARYYVSDSVIVFFTRQGRFLLFRVPN